MTKNPLNDLYDSDIIAIEKGPLAWMREKQRSSMDLEDFRRTAIGKFAEIGIKADVLTYDTTEEGVFAFDIEIQGRLDNRTFDYDRMVHEVTNNILELPDQDGGVIKFDPHKLATTAAKHKH